MAPKNNKIKTPIKTMRLGVVCRIALKNILRRKSRAVVTVGGLSVAIALVLVLVSFGYGLQDLVVRNFTTLEALRTIDVSPEKSEQIRLDDASLEEILELEQVTEVLPVVELGAKMSYNGSVTDVAVVGLSKETFDKWTSLDIQDPSALEQFDDTKLIATHTALNLVGVTGENNATGQEVNLEISVTAYANGVEEIVDDFEIITTESNSASPIVFVPIEYFQEAGVNRYSQAKVVTTNSDDVPNTRLLLEKMGYKTRTAQDTIDQIADIFRIFRFSLATLGIVAGVVATLGMFNTLTVSLMEKTREIGILKALGTQTRTILQLFLVEALIMGIGGGALGIIFGYGTTRIIQSTLAGMAKIRGHELDSLFAFPIPFMLAVFLASLLVGLLTGIYPARKAAKINTLDALRYE